MASIVILGGGFAGLIAAEELSKSLGAEHIITLISTGENFVFYPALVQVAFGACEPEDITFDLEVRLRELDVRFVAGKINKLDLVSKKVNVTGKDIDGEIFYDFLVIAMGRRFATEEVRGFFEFGRHLLDVESALAFGEDIKDFKAGTIVVGMSPRALLPVPVCETAFALAERFKSKIDKGKVNIRAVFPESIKGAFGGADLTQVLTAAFEKHNVAVTTEFPVSEILPGKLLTADGRTLSFDLLMLLPPFGGQSFLKSLGISDEFDFITTDDQMRIPEYPGVFAVGDIVDFPGPKLAYMAVRQAKVAAANIVAQIKGQEPDEYYYHEIATIIDAGNADSIYLHFGIWDDQLYRLKQGSFWSHIKKIHDELWRAAHQE